MVSALQLAAEVLPLPEDRLLTFVEGAQVGCFFFCSFHSYCAGLQAVWGFCLCAGSRGGAARPPPPFRAPPLTRALTPKPKPKPCSLARRWGWWGRRASACCCCGRPWSCPSSWASQTRARWTWRGARAGGGGLRQRRRKLAGLRPPCSCPGSGRAHPRASCPPACPPAHLPAESSHLPHLRLWAAARRWSRPMTRKSPSPKTACGSGGARWRRARCRAPGRRCGQAGPGWDGLQCGGARSDGAAQAAGARQLARNACSRRMRLPD